MKKYIIVLMACMLLLAGCEKVKKENGDTDSSIVKNDIDESTDESISNENNTTQEKVEYVTAKEFMEYYSITEDQVPSDYVQAFIDDRRITPDRLDRENHLKEFLLRDYENGVLYGYNINRIFQKREASDEKLDEYMKQAEVILFEFVVYYGEFAHNENMVIDLKEGGIYYSRHMEEIPTDDYINWEFAEKLSEDDIAAIRKELPMYILDKKDTEARSGDYSVVIKIRAADGTANIYDGKLGDEKHFMELENYWKGLYKKYFGMEHRFTEL